MLGHRTRRKGQGKPARLSSANHLPLADKLSTILSARRQSAPPQLYRQKQDVGDGCTVSEPWLFWGSWSVSQGGFGESFLAEKPLCANGKLATC